MRIPALVVLVVLQSNVVMAQEAAPVLPPDGAPPAAGADVMQPAPQPAPQPEAQPAPETPQAAPAPANDDEEILRGKSKDKKKKKSRKGDDDGDDGADHVRADDDAEDDEEMDGHSNPWAGAGVVAAGVGGFGALGTLASSVCSAGFGAACLCCCGCVANPALMAVGGVVGALAADLMFARPDPLRILASLSLAAAVAFVGTLFTVGAALATAAITNQVLNLVGVAPLDPTQVLTGQLSTDYWVRSAVGGVVMFPVVLILIGLTTAAAAGAAAAAYGLLATMDKGGQE